MKKRDIILIIVLLVIAGASYLIMQTFSADGGKVVVTVDSTVVYEGELSKDDSYDILQSDGSNTVVIKDGKVSMSQADCPDQICVDHKAISKTGETIVCLPHKVVVSIEDGEESEVDTIAQ